MHVKTPISMKTASFFHCLRSCDTNESHFYLPKLNWTLTISGRSKDTHVDCFARHSLTVVQVGGHDNSVSGQGLHPSKAAFEDRLRHSGVIRLFHFLKCSPIYPKIHCAPVINHYGTLLIKRIWCTPRIKQPRINRKSSIDETVSFCFSLRCLRWPSRHPLKDAAPELRHRCCDSDCLWMWAFGYSNFNEYNPLYTVTRKIETCLQC